MPRFYFDTSNGTSVLDDVGEIVADRQAAEIEASKIAREIIKNEIDQGLPFDRAIQVRDETGEPILRIQVTVRLEIQHLK